ncbi:MAG TPA: hypothetical protein VII65_00005, partial [Acidimicrobiales bacterium]
LDLLGTAYSNWKNASEVYKSAVGVSNNSRLGRKMQAVGGIGDLTFENAVADMFARRAKAEADAAGERITHLVGTASMDAAAKVRK